MELTAEELVAREQKKHTEQQIAEWVRHAEKAAGMLEIEFRGFRDIAFPLVRPYHLTRLKAFLGDLQIAVDQLDLITQGKEVTYWLESKVVGVPSDAELDRILGLTLPAEPSDGGNAD